MSENIVIPEVKDDENTENIICDEIKPNIRNVVKNITKNSPHYISDCLIPIGAGIAVGGIILRYLFGL